jgi:hypothetical protein
MLKWFISVFYMTLKQRTVGFVGKASKRKTVEWNSDITEIFELYWYHFSV